MRRETINVFLFLNCLLAIYYFDSWANGNTTSRVLPAVAFIKDGTYNFEKIDSNSHDKSIIGGKHFTDKAPLPTLLFIPIAVVLEKTKIVDISHGDYSRLYAWSGFLFATLPFIMLIMLTLRRARSMLPEKMDLLYLMLPWFGSFIFAYSASMYSHVFAGFLLVLALISVEKEKYVLAGFILGAVFVTEYPLAIVTLVWAVQIWYKKGFQKILLLGLGGIPFIVLIAYYNFAITGNPYTLLYKYVDPNYAFMHTAYGMELPSLKISLQILFGQYKGILLYCPIFGLIMYYGLKNWFQQKAKLKLLLLDPIVLPFVLCVLLISSYAMWWGGWAFGVRHMIALTILLLYRYLPLFATKPINKWVGYPVLLAGAFVGLLAKITCIYSVPSEVDYPLLFMWNDFVTHPGSNPNNFLVLFLKLDTRLTAYIYLGLFFACVLTIYLLQKRNAVKAKHKTNQ